MYCKDCGTKMRVEIEEAKKEKSRAYRTIGHIQKSTELKILKNSERKVS